MELGEGSFVDAVQKEIGIVINNNSKFFLKRMDFSIEVCLNRKEQKITNELIWMSLKVEYTLIQGW